MDRRLRGVPLRARPRPGLLLNRRCSGSAPPTGCCSSCRGRSRASSRLHLALPLQQRLRRDQHAAAGGGLDAVPLARRPDQAKISVIAVNVWMGVPFMMVAVLGGLQSIPGELYEAAEMDGATPWQRFRFITIPGLRPCQHAVVLLGTIWTFNMFPVIYLISGADPAAPPRSWSPRPTSSPSRSAPATTPILRGMGSADPPAPRCCFAVVYRRVLRKQGDTGDARPTAGESFDAAATPGERRDVAKSILLHAPLRRRCRHPRCRPDRSSRCCGSPDLAQAARRLRSPRADFFNQTLA